MNLLKRILKKVFSRANIFMVLAVTAVYAAPTLNKAFFADNEVLTHSKLNEAIVPNGAVIAFNLSDCPTGWVKANGITTDENGAKTPDLRGVFVRGLGSQDYINTDVTPNETVTYAAGNLGLLQPDAFQGHTHGWFGSGSTTYGFYLSQTNSASGGETKNNGGIGAYADNGAPRFGKETRPANVALLYCMRVMQ